ncbi:MAG: response regulator [Deltaproteobacteria bacterium]|jgi:DNA-binding response OmpR family regulator|nr:response regulator [Deltaproteobacteria bacterium]MBT4642062.1 response regulator [Deltaproteobacteria bacterium]MBT6498426.1 response regulator [Deltaproteobacteria bacterium]MBT6612474.1 response regulator [Deltaproteobacteria bacterium]MBT7152966.1 response regulator [Deltaproteobacteria bacterium]
MTKILIIEDDNDFRQMLHLTLKHNGYDVIEAADGQKGVELYYEEKPDLVITDIFMPGKEGVETVIELRESNPNIKIIAISGAVTHSKLNFLSEMQDIGVQKVFEKPFKSEDFLAGIKELLETA